jgi:hypothetical protein
MLLLDPTTWTNEQWDTTILQHGGRTQWHSYARTQSLMCHTLYVHSPASHLQQHVHTRSLHSNTHNHTIRCIPIQAYTLCMHSYSCSHTFTLSTSHTHTHLHVRVLTPVSTVSNETLMLHETPCTLLSMAWALLLYPFYGTSSWDWEKVTPSGPRTKYRATGTSPLTVHSCCVPLHPATTTHRSCVQIIVILLCTEVYYIKSER